MEDKLIDIIYDKIKDINFYNYDNDEEFKDVSTREYVNILGNKCIEIKLEHETYLINCIEVHSDRELK